MATAYLDDAGEPVRLERDYYLAVCETCGDILLYAGWVGTHDGRDAPFTEAYRAWPEPPLNPEVLPKAVAECYRDALAVKRKSPPAFAVMARKTLEALCADRTAKGKNLAGRLRVLSDRGQLPPTLAGMSQVLRELGNIGAHDDVDRITADDADRIDHILRAIFEYVYVAPLIWRDALKRLGYGE